MVQLADVLTKDGVEREQMHAAMRGAIDVFAPDEAYARNEAAPVSRAARAELRREARNSARVRAAAECRVRHEGESRRSPYRSPRRTYGSRGEKGNGAALVRPI